MIRDDQKVYRVTFSRSLAEFIIRDKSHLRVEKVQVVTGKVLGDKKSPNGLYALCSRRSGRILRVSLQQEIALELCDNDSREIREAWLDLS